MSILRIMSNGKKDGKYIDNVLSMIDTIVYKKGTMDDGRYDYYINTYKEDIDYITRQFINIYDTYEFDSDLPIFQVDPEFMLNKNFYNNEFHDPVIAQYDDICILSKYAENANADLKNFIYEDSEKLYSFKYNELMEDILILLKCILDNKDINSVLIIGRNHNLYSSILSSYNQLSNIDHCDINEYGRYSNKEYDCILIIPYMESQIRDIFHIGSKNYILYGIYNNYRNTIYYSNQYLDIYKKYEEMLIPVNQINSRYWNGMVFGHMSISRYDNSLYTPTPILYNGGKTE